MALISSLTDLSRAWTHRRALIAQDRRSARLAELTLIGDVLGAAGSVIDHGWLQHDWFGTDDADPELPSTRACLVGAVILAAGGPQTRQSQLVQRALDLVWHAFAEDPRTPVRFCPPSNVRMARVRHLTSWNDEVCRHPEDVVALLARAADRARHERDVLLPATGRPAAGSCSPSTPASRTDASVA